MKNSDMKKLRKMGAGAFVAVAQGSDLKTPPSYLVKHPAHMVAVEGTFDTGGLSSRRACTTCTRT